MIYLKAVDNLDDFIKKNNDNPTEDRQLSFLPEDYDSSDETPF